METKLEFPFPPSYSQMDLARITGISRYKIETEVKMKRLIPVQHHGPMRFTKEEIERWWAEYDPESRKALGALLGMVGLSTEGQGRERG